jgi:hypothetical protein
MTRRISAHEELKINQALADLKDVPERVKALLIAMDKPHWEKDETKSINHPAMPFYALIAYQEKLLTDLQFGTLLLYQSIRDYYQDNDKISSSFFQFDLTNPKLVDYDPTQNKVPEAILKYYSIDVTKPERKDISSTIRKVNEEIKKLPLSEQICFVVPDKYEQSDILIFIKQYINQLTLNIDLEANELRIPSLSILQILINHFHPHPLKVNPVIGLSTTKDILDNGIQSMRDVALHFPLVFLPAIADFNNAHLFKFTLHDFFHFVRASDIPVTDRLIFIEIGKLLDEIVLASQKVVSAKHAEICKNLTYLPSKAMQLIHDYIVATRDESIQMIANFFYDFDFPSYEQNLSIKLSPQQQFLTALADGLALIEQFNKSENGLTPQFTPLKGSTIKKIIFKIFDYLETVKSPHRYYISDLASKIRAEDPLVIPEFISPIKKISIQYAYGIQILWKEYYRIRLLKSIEDPEAKEIPSSETTPTSSDNLNIQVEKEIPVIKSAPIISDTPPIPVSLDASEETVTPAETPTIFDKIMKCGEHISQTFDDKVTASVKQILVNQNETQQWCFDRNFIDSNESHETYAAMALIFGVSMYCRQNLSHFFLLPYADLSAKTLGTVTYSVGNLLKHGLLFWRERNEKSRDPKNDREILRLQQG